jgi:hypothetical protein
MMAQSRWLSFISDMWWLRRPLLLCQHPHFHLTSQDSNLVRYLSHFSKAHTSEIYAYISLLMAESNREDIYNSVPLPLGDSIFVRVVTIRASTISRDSSRIACDFHLLDLETKLLRQSSTTSRTAKPVGYTALSYTWGDATPLQTINLDGKPFTVRKNLWDFLNRAREDCFSGYLWIDALCIDQSRVGERNHQVAMMGSIYSKASGVIVWLGQVSERIKLAMQEASDALFNKKPRGTIWMQHRKGVQEFYNLPYWNRAWIVQEYILARTIDIWCDQFRLREDGLLYLCRSRNTFFTLVEEEHPSNEKLTSHDLSAENIIESRERGRQNAFNTAHRGLVALNVVEMMEFIRGSGRNMQCTDPRDRVYSLLSLLSSAGRERFAVTADYSRSTSELFTCVYASFRREWSWQSNYTRKSHLLSLQEMLELDDEDPAVQGAFNAFTLTPGYDRNEGKFVSAGSRSNVEDD